jgi:amidase
MWTAPEPERSFVEAAAAEPGRLRVGWTVKPTTPGVRVDPRNIRAVEWMAQVLTDLGHDVHEIDPHWPDTTLAFIPQFLGGLKVQARGVEHYERLEPRTRQTYRLGTWVTPGVVRRGLRVGERVSAKANRIFDHVDVLLTPTMPGRPPKVGQLDRLGLATTIPRSMSTIAFTALWNVTGNPAAAVPAGIADDGLPLSCQLVGRRADETTLLSLAAQVEEARPWTMPPPERYS